jgi:hypothetical protein
VSRELPALFIQQSLFISEIKFGILQNNAKLSPAHYIPPLGVAPSAVS